jgi:hypothetical protein
LLNKEDISMTKENFIALAESRYDDLNKLCELDNFYDYEKSFDAIWQDLGRVYLEQLLQGEQPKSKDRRMKKKH